jgi:histidinol-phosphate aminotransferase
MQKIPQNVIVVMDEAYFEYVTDNHFPDSLEYVQEERNLIVLRTFSKAYGLAGLRLGYAMAPARLIGYMERIREPFNANYLAQKAAYAALDDTEHVAKTVKNNCVGIAYLSAQMKRLQISFVPTQTNFLLIKIGTEAENVYQMLLEEGIMVRSMSSYGLYEYIRVTIGLPEDNKRFIGALEKLLSKVIPKDKYCRTK